MIDILSESENDVLAAKISGKLTSDDYDKLRPELDLRANQDANFSMLVEIADIEGMEAETIREDLRFTADYRDDIERLAVVTQDSWWGRFTDFIGSPIGEMMGIETERFDDRTAAWKWLQGNRSN